MDISTTYMGLTLESPVIVGSSGLTDSVEKLKRIEDAGAGAAVLKSIFEEEIAYEYNDMIKDVSLTTGYNLEQFDYLDMQLRGKKLSAYLDLIKEAKAGVSMPVIASVNCVYSHEWASFAKQIADAGADALELNMFFAPTDFERESSELEKVYFQIVEKLLKTITIPVSLKISYYFSNLGRMIQRLSETGISGIVLFNRFFSPDIDTDKLEVKPSFLFSSPSDIAISLRWMAIMSQRVKCDLAASTGVHDAQGVIKHLLAGAQAVQMVSTLYKNKTPYLKTVIRDIRNWMETHGFNSLDDFRGKLSQAEAQNPAVYDRLQFMKYYS
ncbi:diguanylate cyclase [Desulfobacter hydrogenophilus]|uniref:Diguanylate cyclase n=1 Tax=Desulfobacter hydrogenophilus TaxID=2291 RepID=A0A328F9L0_9BACT|nr:dihydroorotate dehydrogenase-like protein [Desulfobacter hydrogenophilus]NDY72591.1 dihydroorotate dehydrogenase-like protein [Desulfobacter hydrogenophilus]QBH13312.1 dihydroorotate dehydrogenase-like protein [Desulfobacter hydrogenophilus]RAM01288.1 diguanylate cyclase [Desulfobacter hydrogenophilus]